MPTYEYECVDCGTRFDVFQSITASPLRKSNCESCGAVRKVKRLIGTGAAVMFKGSGFYETDYRRKKGGGEVAGKEESKSSQEAKAGETKAESKGEAKVGETGGGKSDSKGESKPSGEAKSAAKGKKSKSD